MMEIVRESLVWLFLVAGGLFCLIGGVGMLRMPDFYTRSHAASVTDTLGATLILTGLIFHSGVNLISVKLVLVLILLYVTSPTAAHALVKAAYSRGIYAPDFESPDVSGLASRPDSPAGGGQGDG